MNVFRMILSGFYIFLFSFYLPIEAKRRPSVERIIGGTEVSDTKHPYFAQVIHEYYPDFVCGSTIITPNAVITASSCSAVAAKYLSLRVGSVFYNDGPLYQVALIETFSYREYFKISLLFTYSEFTFSDVVKAIQLPDHNYKYYEEEITGTICGFGSSDYDSKKSKRLLELQVKIITYEECRKAFSEDNDVGPKSFCAIPTTKGFDTCTGDLGGPFVYKGVLLGVIQYDRGCGIEDKATVYTQVAKYVEWINEKIKPYNSKRVRRKIQGSSCDQKVCQDFSTMNFKWNDSLNFCLEGCKMLLPKVKSKDQICVPNRISDSEFITSIQCTNLKDHFDKPLKLDGTMPNIRVKINDVICDVINFKTGHDLMPKQTIIDNDIVIIKLGCDPQNFKNIRTFQVLAPMEEQISIRKGFVINQVFQSGRNVSSDTIPVYLIPSHICNIKFTDFISLVPFNLSHEMFCIAPRSIVALDLDLCSEKEGAPVLEIKGHLVGVVVWQELCSNDKINVVLGVSKLIQTYFAKQNKTKIEEVKFVTVEGNEALKKEKSKAKFEFRFR